MQLLSYFALGLYAAASLFLLLHGLNAYVLTGSFLSRFRRRDARTADEEAARVAALRARPERLPKIATQIPLYNELNVAERIIRAVGAMEYPADRHEIQILDDSTDETRAAVDATAAELLARGLDVRVLRRPERTGYKAGALQYGLERTDAAYVAIFDADFAPPADFLLRCLASLEADPKAGLAQARWGHLNPKDSLLTRAVAMGIDGHFAVEQNARCWSGLLLNFNGTAGLWRRAAIEDAGGWQSDTLTEDMDLSYRSQLAGWRIRFLHDLVVPAEVPDTFAAFKSQQFRWAKGSIQTARKLLPRTLRAPLPLWTKIQAAFHLTHYFIHPCMLAIATLAMPLLLAVGAQLNPIVYAFILPPLVLATLGPTCLYAASQWSLYPDPWRRLTLLPALVAIGFGICLSNTKAVAEALLGVRSGFIRTPKKGTNLKDYRLPLSFLPWTETALALYCLAALGLSFVATNGTLLSPYLALYASGFAIVGVSALLERRRARPQ